MQVPWKDLYMLDTKIQQTTALTYTRVSDRCVDKRRDTDKKHVSKKDGYRR